MKQAWQQLKSQTMSFTKLIITNQTCTEIRISDPGLKCNILERLTRLAPQPNKLARRRVTPASHPFIGMSNRRTSEQDSNSEKPECEAWC